MSIEDEVIEVCRHVVGKGYERRPLQEEAIKRVIRWLENDSGRPFILRLPTGYGKTLIGLAPALYQIARNDWRYFRSLTYVLPMRALCSQVAENTRRYVHRILSSQVESLSIREFHGGAVFSGRFSGDIIVTTYDTFVYAYARKLGAMLDYPAGTLATSLIVLDEAQMIQDEEFYSYTLLKKILKAFIDSGIPVLLMTATLPEKIKQTLFSNMGLEEFYPSSEDLAREEFKGFITEIQYRRDILDVNTIEESIEEYEKLFGDYPRRVFVVFNTVERLRNTWEDLHLQSKTEKEPVFKHYKIICLHGRQKNIERRYKIGKVERLCGNPTIRLNTIESERIILLSTQVIEAGLDISGDLLVTELAPVDSIVQRIGRCGRFRGEKGVVVITEVESSQPYPRDLIEASRKTIREAGQNITKKLQDYEIVSELINNVYKEWTPREIEPDLLRYIIYLEKSLGPLNGDLEAAKSLTFKMDDYIEVILPHSNAKLIYCIAEEAHYIDGWRLRIFKGPFLASNIIEILDKAYKLREESHHLLLIIEGEDIINDTSIGLKNIDEWVNDNSVSISLTKHKGLPKPLRWKISGKELLFTLSEVPEKKIEGLNKPAIIIRAIEAGERIKRGSVRIYLGNPDFYKKDLGLELNER